MTNYDVIRVERKTAESLGINSSVQKRALNRKKNTSGDYSNTYVLYNLFSSLRVTQSDDPNTFVRMLQGLVEGLIGVSMSLTLLSSRLDFFFFIICPLGMSLIQMTMFLG